MADLATQDEDAHAGERLLSRLLFFSDAVFAIVLTLLVLELRPPEGSTDAELMEGLGHLLPHMIAFTTSFALVSVFWLAHMSIMRTARAFSWTVAAFNLVFLFTISLMPFVSAVLGETKRLALAWEIYCIALMTASAAQTALLIAVTSTSADIGAREFSYRVLRALSPGLAFGVGLALTIAGYLDYAFWSPALIPVIFLLSKLLLGPRKARVKD
jgi:uncharacterized membrane protein